MEQETKQVIKGLATILFVIIMICKIFGPMLIWLWVEILFPLLGIIIYGLCKIAPLGTFIAVIRGDNKLAFAWIITYLVCYMIGNLLV